MNKSFTLIEILVVIVVIGVLSAFILVGMSSISNSANIAKGQAFSNSLRNSLLMNLVAEWKFDDISGTIGSTLPDGTSFSDSWGTYSGTTSGSPTLKGGTDCVKEECLSFNGSTSYITPTNIALATITANQLTVETWVKFNVVNVNQFIITKNGPIFFYLQGSTSKLLTQILTDTWTLNTSTASISTNKWYHTVSIYDGTNIKLYLNGVADSSTPKTGNLSGSGCLQIARYNDGGCTTGVSSYFNGLLDETRIYKGVLSQSQIEERYVSGVNSLLAKGLISSQEYAQRLKEFAKN